MQAKPRTSRSSFFLEIFQAAAQFDPARGNLKGWLLQYAYHRSMNRRDYLAKRKFYDPDATSPDENGAVETAVAGSTGAGRLALPELQSLMRQGLAKLSSHQRLTLHMAYFEGKSLREIAEETGESVANIRHYYYRGLKSLRSFVSGKSDRSGGAKSTILRRGTIDVEA
jgi:RNA polymerase sigma-70 factor, ECF subfamily